MSGDRRHGGRVRRGLRLARRRPPPALAGRHAERHLYGEWLPAGRAHARGWLHPAPGGARLQPPTLGQLAEMAIQLEAKPTPETRKPPRLGYRIFDVDVHTSFRRASDLAPYLPERYKRRFLEA